MSATAQRQAPTLRIAARSRSRPDDPLARVGKRCGRVVGVDLASQAVPVEGSLRDDPGRDAVPDPVERLDSLAAQPVEILGELEVL